MYRRLSTDDKCDKNKHMIDELIEWCWTLNGKKFMHIHDESIIMSDELVDKALLLLLKFCLQIPILMTQPGLKLSYTNDSVKNNYFQYITIIRCNVSN